MGAFANVDKARDVLGWRASLTIEDAIASALAWRRKRKDVLGYE
jgi:UDP-glucose 4-epimerase